MHTIWQSTIFIAHKINNTIAMYLTTLFKHGNADGLSLLYLPSTESEDTSPATLFNVSQVNTLPVNADLLKRDTAKCCTLYKGGSHCV